MPAVMIGVDPHKASHTAVVISAAEEPLGELRVRACAVQRVVIAGAVPKNPSGKILKRQLRREHNNLAAQV